MVEVCCVRNERFGRTECIYNILDEVSGNTLDERKHLVCVLRRVCVLSMCVLSMCVLKIMCAILETPYSNAGDVYRYS